MDNHSVLVLFVVVNCDYSRFDSREPGVYYTGLAYLYCKMVVFAVRHMVFKVIERTVFLPYMIAKHDNQGHLRDPNQVPEESHAWIARGLAANQGVAYIVKGTLHFRKKEFVN